MKYRNLSIWRNIDKPLLIMYLLLSVIGYFIMYSSTFKGLDIRTDFWSTNYGKQLIWIIITLFAGFLFFYWMEVLSKILRTSLTDLFCFYWL